MVVISLAIYISEVNILMFLRQLSLAEARLNKYMATNAYHSIEPRKHGGEAIRKTHNIIDNYEKHKGAKTRCQSAQLSLYRKFLRDFFSTGKILAMWGAHDSTRVGRLFRALRIFFHF